MHVYKGTETSIFTYKCPKTKKQIILAHYLISTFKRKTFAS